jgi:homoaconitase/3-isopropylmalate dehydratase large subunit
MKSISLRWNKLYEMHKLAFSWNKLHGLRKIIPVMKGMVHQIGWDVENVSRTSVVVCSNHGRGRCICSP